MRRVAPWLYAGLIFFLSAQSKFDGVPVAIWSFDKVIHFVEYGVFGVLIYRALPRSALASVLIAIAYGISDEFHQSFVPGRTSSVWDALADALGATGAILIWKYLFTARAPAVSDTRSSLSRSNNP